MDTELLFTELTLNAGDFGPETSVPDLMPMDNLQNKTQYFLDDTDEIYEGYGRMRTAYPYRHRSMYSRALAPRAVRCAVLENACLRAEFLPDYGGRLWRLYDKTAQRELLYTNDVLRASNLAVRDAWFAGGVEWNIGVIGHTPLTTEPLFTARLTMPDGSPVLRMYEYERIRGVVYQMDFWLDADAPVLYAAMRVTNPAAEVTPMYWWSNIAAQQYENGRVLVPATEAFTSDRVCVRKVPVPMVDGVDISHYNNIPHQVDYFFNIPPEAPKFIANVDADGYGLLHTSTARLQSRKLFSWGTNDASKRWQEFLCGSGKPYLEIQAGLGKTQYGCIPMAPHTTWDWVEAYSPLTLSAEEQAAPFAEASALLSRRIAQHTDVLEAAQEKARVFAKMRADLHSCAGGYGALENALRAADGQEPMTSHLDFTSDDMRQQEWHMLLQTGALPTPLDGDAPADFMCGLAWLDLLQKAAARPDASWYASYQLGLVLWQQKHFSMARAILEHAAGMEENAWTLQALAALYLCEGKPDIAAPLMTKGILLRPADASYVKEGVRLLVRAEAWPLIAGLFDELDERVWQEPRMRFYRAQTLLRLGDARSAQELLCADGGLEIADLRECEASVGALWREVHDTLHERAGEPIPHFFNFDSLAEESMEQGEH
ncbi:MAG: DUF5107 domain-containing protein [Ruthenibacterium sp.]